MTTPAGDAYECFRELIQLLRAENAGVTADRLETLLNSAWTTSSELLGELGLEIVEFQRCGYEPQREELRNSIEACLSRIRQAWPDIR
jgi:hypothetical protein